MARKPSYFDNHPMDFPESPTYRAYCEYVVDGDTMDVFVDIGLNKYAYESIRLANIDTPEIFRPKSEEERKAGYEAKRFVEEKILHRQVKIVTYKDKQTFNRYQADIYYHEDGEWKSLADELKAAGFDWADKK